MVIAPDMLILVQFLLIFDQIKLQESVLHLNRLEFYQESNGHGPRHVTRVCHVSDALHVNRPEFYEESNAHGPRHVTTQSRAF